jgi:hypothetical protein
MAYLFKFVAAPSPRRRRVFDCWTCSFLVAPAPNGKAD